MRHSQVNVFVYYIVVQNGLEFSIELMCNEDKKKNRKKYFLRN